MVTTVAGDTVGAVTTSLSAIKSRLMKHARFQVSNYVTMICLIIAMVRLQTECTAGGAVTPRYDIGTPLGKNRSSGDNTNSERAVSRGF